MATRFVKDADEIENCRAAARIADAGMVAAVDTVRQGGNEREISIASMAAMNRLWTDAYPDKEVCDFGSLEGGVQNGLWTWALSGDRMFMNCDNPTTRKPAPGETVSILIWTIIILYALAGGGVGWWIGTKAIYRPSSHALGDVDISPETLARRKLRRIVLSLAGLSGGALVGLVFLLFLAR